MENRIPEDFINKVRENNDLVEVASEYMTLKRNGDRYTGLCPFHREDTPSFNISVDKQLYHCFGCGVGGNVINFIMGIENIDFLDAIKLLADRCGMSIPDRAAKKGLSDEYKLTRRILEANVTAARYYVKCLSQSKEAMDYLVGRGLDKTTIIRFGLGYAPDRWVSLTKYMQRKGFELALLEKAGLARRNKKGSGVYDRFRNRIIFPIIDIRKRLVGFGGRAIGDSEGPKYLNSPETPVFLKGSTLYGLNIAKNHIEDGQIIIVEGYMDVISLHREGISNVVASLGTAFTSKQAEILKRYSSSIIIAYDTDTAGQAATHKGMDILETAGCRVKILRLPEGKDPDEYIRSHGKQGFEQLVKDALPLTDYRLAVLEEKYDLSDRQDRIDFLKEAVSVLAKLESELELTEYIKTVVQKTGAYESTVRREILRVAGRGKAHKRNIHGKNRHNSNVGEYSYSVKAAYFEAEKNLLILMLKDFDLRNRIAQRLETNDFTDALHRRLFEMIRDVGADERVIEADIINSFTEQHEVNRVVDMVQQDLPLVGDDMDKFVNDCIHTLYIHKYKLRSDFLKGEIERLTSRGKQRTQDQEEMYRGYCEEFVKVQRKLKGL